MSSLYLWKYLKICLKNWKLVSLKYTHLKIVPKVITIHLLSFNLDRYFQYLEKTFGKYNKIIYFLNFRPCLNLFFTLIYIDENILNKI